MKAIQQEVPLDFSQLSLSHRYQGRHWAVTGMLHFPSWPRANQLPCTFTFLGLKKKKKEKHIIFYDGKKKKGKAFKASKSCCES